MKKNVLLIMTDQMRFDSISINGNKIISTPVLDDMISKGINYINAYSSCPTCVPARASLLTGLKPKNTGRIGYLDNIPFEFEKTIATYFSERGYYTKCIGKMHVYPSRKMCGFHHIELHDGYLHTNRNINKPYHSSFENSDDYLTWLKEKLGHDVDINDLGLDCNSWVARPYELPEKFHPTNWVVTRAIDFLKKRDKDMPFFLKMSFVRPHSPYDPPKYYYDMYMEELKDLKIEYSNNLSNTLGISKTYDIIAKKGIIDEKHIKRMLAGYYGLISHIDNQIGRFMIHLEEEQILNDTIILFISDHGDELNDHNLFRKGYPYQGSIHIPMFIYDPSKKIGKVCDSLVDLSDILPTLIDIGTGDKILEVDGRSVYNLDDSREYIHGEHELGDLSSQFIISKEYKYIWYPIKDIEELYNIKDDPKEENNLVNIETEKLKYYRNILIEELKDREEGFVKNNKLNKVNKVYPCRKFIRDKYNIGNKK